MMSARAKPMDRAFAEEAGATAYLVKPFKKGARLQRARGQCLMNRVAQAGNEG